MSEKRISGDTPLNTCTSSGMKQIEDGSEEHSIPRSFFNEREKELLEENKELRVKLQESEEVLDAIRSGMVDALTVQGPDGPQIFTIKGADHTYRVLIEEMNEGAITLNREAIILYSNSRFSEFVEAPLQLIIGSSFYDFLPPNDHVRFRALFQRGWQKSSRGEFALQSRKGAILPFSISMNALNVSNASVLAMIVTDLSAEMEILAVKSQVAAQNEIISKKEAELVKEKQTKEEAERFRAVLEGIPQIAWTSTPDGQLNYANKFWIEYSGFTFQQTKDLGWQAALHPDDEEKTLLLFGQSLQTGEELNIESRLRRGNDGTYRWHIFRASPVRNHLHQIILWVGTCTDIQVQKEHAEKIDQAREDLSALNQKLNIKNEQLIRTNDDLDTFVYTASHDLRSPILNIEGLINILEKKLHTQGILHDDKQKLIHMINNAINRFKATIQELTEVAKVQKNLAEETTFINFEEVIHEVMDNIQDMIRESNTQIIIDTAEQPEINISRKHLKSIVYNLLSNAIKYRSSERASEVGISTHKVDGWIVLSFRDYGLGMDLSRGNKIFEMFKRLHNHVEGTGVGLYIVKRIVDNMGGRIEVESTLGKGSIFRVYFSAH